MCQFDYQSFFYNDSDMVVAFHADKFTQEEAEPIARYELYAKQRDQLSCRRAWGYYGIGTNQRGERVNQYWLTEEKSKFSFPVLVFSLHR